MVPQRGIFPRVGPGRPGSAPVRAWRDMVVLGTTVAIALLGNMAFGYLGGIAMHRLLVAVFDRDPRQGPEAK